MGELYQVLAQMREEKDFFNREKGAIMNEKARKEEEKECLRRQVVEMDLLRKFQREASDSGDSAEDSDLTIDLVDGE